MKPLNYAILKYFTKITEASADEVIDALKGEYGKFKALNKKAVIESLMTAEANGLLNLTKIMTLSGYVVSYSNVLDMPFTKDENINTYSLMLGDVYEIVKTVDLMVK